MYLSKKGDMQYKVITGLLMLIVGAIVIFAFQQKLFAEVVEGGSDARCRVSIENAALSKTFPSVSGVGKPTYRLDCPRGNLTIKKNDIVEGDAINQDKAHQIIADAMLSCWKKVGSGKVDPFSNWDNPKTSICLICDTLLFDDGLKEFINSAKNEEELINKRSIHGFLPFLLTKSPSGKESYYELLYGLPRDHPDYPKGSDLIKAEENAAKSIVLPGSVILLQMHKLDSKSSTWRTVGYVATGAAAGVAVVGLIVLTGGVAAIPLGLVSLKTGLIVAGLSGVAVAGFSSFGAFTLYTTVGYAFSNCKDCNGVGGINFVASDASFDEEITITPQQGNPYKAKLCNQLVN